MAAGPPSAAADEALMLRYQRLICKVAMNYVKDKQSALRGQLNGLGAQELGSVTKALNGLIVSIDAAKLKTDIDTVLDPSL